MPRVEEVGGFPPMPLDPEGAAEWRHTFGPMQEAEARAMFRSAAMRHVADQPGPRAGLVLDPEAWAELDAFSSWYTGLPGQSGVPRAVEAVMQREATRAIDSVLRVLAPGDAARAIAIARAEGL